MDNVRGCLPLPLSLSSTLGVVVVRIVSGRHDEGTLPLLLLLLSSMLGLPWSSSMSALLGVAAIGIVSDRVNDIVSGCLPAVVPPLSLVVVDAGEKFWCCDLSSQHSKKFS